MLIHLFFFEKYIYIIKLDQYKYLNNNLINKNDNQ